MKILPDYLIEMMPALEEALEELRLSVIDHAYELLKCLDVDELSSDTIRRKLELYDLKIDNMTEEWLPNGKFYRMYPEIKHNRTRLNSLKSVVCSGGQFEGLWSNEFIKEAEHNYNKIRTLRHYSVQSEYDGYFYVSGNVNRISISGSDLVENSTLTALSTDILLGQAMPAGYTYLYVPWPRPAYPADAGYFYNVNMLNADRLHYAINCDTTDSYDESKPASLNYDWENGTNTPWRTPYWFDYHYMGDTNHTDHIEPQLETDDRYAGTWPIHEKGEYGNYNEDGQWVSCNPEDAHFYRLDPSCSELSNSNAIFPTKCYIRSSNRTTHPDARQIFVPRVLEDNEELKIFTIDSGNVDDITKEHTSNPDNFIYGTYRWDHLFDKGFQIIQEMSHIKTYKPIWSESSPIFAMMQSNFNSGLHPEEIAEHSFYNWFDLKQQKNIIAPEESTIENNEPPISEITHTSFDRPTYGRINNGTIIAYFLPFNSDQGNNKYLYPTGSYSFYNKLYYFSNDYFIEVDPNKTYSVDSLAVVNNNDIIIYNMKDYDTVPILGMDISNDGLCLDLNGFNAEYGSYVIFREKETFKTHKFWFSDTHDPLVLDADDTKVYHEVPDEWKAEYSYSNNKSFYVNILGIYDENDELVYYENDATIELALNGSTSSYEWLASKFGEYSTSVIATFTASLNDSWMQVDDSNVRPDYSESDIFSEMSDTHYIFRSYSNAGVDSSEASMYIYVNVTSPCSLSFKVNNDSERPNNTPPDPPSPSSWDYTKVYVDNTLFADFHNEVSWVDCEVTFTTTGTHIIKVSYIKDSSQNSYSDCGYLALSKAITNIGVTPGEISGEISGEVFTPVAASYAICELRKVNTPARYI